MRRVIVLFFVMIFVSVVYAESDSLSPFGESDVSIVIDNSAPIVSIFSPENIIYNNASLILVNYSVIDISLDSVWYSLNEGSNISVLEPFYLDLAEGDYLLRIYANDSLNRVNFSEVFFSVDNSVVFCGNDFCAVDENCVSCSVDCGICTPPPPSEGSGGSSGSGGTGQTLVADFSIDKSLIETQINRGQAKKEKITINNIGSTALSFELNVLELEEFITLSEEFFVLSLGEVRIVYVNFIVEEDVDFGVYTGSIGVSAGGITKTINILLDILKKEALFDLSSRLKEDILTKAQQIESTITITDISGLGRVDVLLEYFIKDFSDNEIKLSEETIEVDGSLEIERKFSIPDSLDVGEYVFYVRLTQEDNFAVSSQAFVLKEEIFFYRNIGPLIVLLLLVLLVLYILFKKNRRPKKRK